MEEIWKLIKEYPNYQVSNLGRVKNKKGHMLRFNKRNVTFSSGMKQTSFSIGKLMYSAFGGIELSKLKNVHTSGDTLETLQVADIATCLEKLRQDKKTKKRDPKEIEKNQIEAFEDMRIILEAWSSEKSESLYFRINSYKSDIISCICHRFGSKESVAKSIWDESSYLLLSYIMGKERAVGSFRGWLWVTSKNLMRQYREASKKTKYMEYMSFIQECLE